MPQKITHSKAAWALASKLYKEICYDRRNEPEHLDRFAWVLDNELKTFAKLAEEYGIVLRERMALQAKIDQLESDMAHIRDYCGFGKHP